MISDLLEKYSQAKDSERKNIENEIWELYGTKGAIAIWDMSDFTRITQEKGIVYFLSLIEKMKNNCQYIFEKHNGVSIRILADDIFVKFDTIDEAVNCALDIRKWCDDQEDIEMSCGISYGEFLEVKDDEGNLVNVFGDPVNKAFRLGENTADNGEILIDSEILNKLNV
jgi:adenylate cyclase